jgi:aspartyl protease family protein
VNVAAWLAIGFFLIAALTFGLMSLPENAFGISNIDLAYSIRAFVILLFVSAAIATSYWGKFGQAVRHLAVWVVLGIVLVWGYSHRTDLVIVANSVIAKLHPAGKQINVSNKTVRIKRAHFNTQFLVQTKIRGWPVEMIVDTGASTVTLRYEDAKRLGIDMRRLQYAVPVQTANGEAYFASVKLPDISIEKIRIEGVKAYIAKPGSLHQSLLGMNFLRRLRSYEFSGDILELRG